MDYKHLLFPPERQEYELVYAIKEREEDVLAETMALPLQPNRSYGSKGPDWDNILIFGDNLQALKTLLKLKEEGKLINSDGSRGVKLVYVDPPFATMREFQGAQQEAEFTVGSAEIENTKAYIAGSIADMQSFLVDVGENVPKEEGAFQKVEDAKFRANCNFLVICYKPE